MLKTTRTMDASKNIALVAHDHRKPALLAWVACHREDLAQHRLFATGTTGNLIGRDTGLDVTSLMSGPMGGDQQLGALICEGKIDAMIFFWDPLDAVPHDPDVKALLRLAAVWNIPVATNQSSADFLIASPLMTQRYDAEIPDYQGYLRQRLR